MRPLLYEGQITGRVVFKKLKMAARTSSRMRSSTSIWRWVENWTSQPLFLPSSLLIIVYRSRLSFRVIWNGFFPRTAFSFSRERHYLFPLHPP
ncbi:hypothetical protein NPIL_40481 [Nephila pilipes]|uniref:Uncharacterized protein n=1 Tax=Nephila pilipes TaxID=299642 RepID=A0A8X6Q1F0_NEPPI|nr:hypothetical protein NPIL_40481 [Nephila pilipes]